MFPTEAARLPQDIVFPDFDLDADDLGGILEWQAPSDTSKVRGHVLSASFLGNAVSTIRKPHKSCKNYLSS